jgi:hypothetical protein
MIPTPSGVRVWLAVGHSDMRKGMHSLALQVQQALGRDPYVGDLYVFRGRKAKHTTFHIQFASRDNCLSLAPFIGADVASLAASAGQRADVHLHDRATWLQPGVAQLDVRSSLLRRNDARRAPDQPGRSY